MAFRSFQEEIKTDEDIPQDILQALLQGHKLNAMDNPNGIDFPFFLLFTINPYWYSTFMKKED
ncbi:hypothetical protein P4361_11730 [Fictibacillus sp. B-59209]|uniref:hypothetical protein n=1 Tax=Fictibacillus sp. B-59209 TaxID=3024873 RepID=UPI002E1AB637|nr:hypothetical protein [Fictibacillus sp. B-59209]